VLLLVTLGLVLASAVLLILGFVQDALGFIYLSMLCAGVAALALFVFARLARRRGAALAGAGIAGGTSPYLVGPDRQEAPSVRAEPGASSTREMAPVVAAPEAIDGDGFADLEEEPEEPAFVPAAPAIGAAAPVPPGGWSGDDVSEDWGDEIMFPIEDYDELRVAEILPLLAQLEPDELQEVRDREVAGKARNTILDRIDDRLGRRAGGVPVVAPPVIAPEPAIVPAAAPAATKGRAPAARATKKTAAASEPAAPAPAPRGRRAAAASAPAKDTATTRKAAGTASKKAAASAGPTASTTGGTASAPAKKAPAKKAAATKTAAAKAAAPATKATAKKAAASKAAPATKATKAAAKKR
jgi:hypothetical protein